MKLKFLGSGSAFNTILGNTSAYIKEENCLLLIDCGSNIFERIMKMKLLDKVRYINVIITHAHADHCGSLGDLIFYCYYITKTKVNVYSIDTGINDILEKSGCKNLYNYFNIFYNIPIVLNNYKIIPIKTEHVKEISSSGLLFESKKEKFYYSGDSKNIPDNILNKLENGELNYFFQDTCGVNYKNNPHMDIDTLISLIQNTEIRKKVYCMHLDDVDDLRNKIILNGFNVVENAYQDDTPIEPVENKTVAVYCGSFDPITNGHIDIIEKARKIYGKLIIGVLNNSDKNCLFDLLERKELIQRLIDENQYDNVTVKIFNGLTTDFARMNNAKYLIRGIRDSNDFEYESKMLKINKKLDKDVETLLLMADEKYQLISSSLVKEFAKYKRDINWMVPYYVKEQLDNKLNPKE